ncbi:MAG TPA: choice-of-anchor L domain-containing protein [Saprospiraceae bacterium]|nr:choice-of-anchor L domain-containing protein [Saprospiraceae bacterium]
MRLRFGYILLMIGMLAFRPDTPAALASPPDPPPMGSIRTRSDVSTESLVRDIFAKGTCDNISRIRSIGNRDGIGFFENGSHVIGMDKGIILATGPVKHAEGPNRQGDKSGGFGGPDGDPDLGLFVNERILDVVGIEFDFEPLDSFVQFRYVFASEEYCEFVGSVYNDVFGFFVSGPGINGPFSRGAQNMALIPHTNDYVAINSVNHIYNHQYFIRNELERDARQCGIEPIVSPYHSTIEYDGFTTILTATLKLIPCEKYRIRFVVADVGDRFYDSAVFLEAESFNIGGTVLLHAEGSEGNRAMEGCNDAYFVFTRGERDNLNQALTVQFKITNASTAREGQDFATLPRSITIPAGQMSVRLPVRVFNDGIAEPDEKIVIELDIPCACYTGSATLVITDAPAMSATLHDQAACHNSFATLTPSASGGVPPYTYQWSTGSLTPSISAPPGFYTVTISDQCGNSAVDSCLVFAIEAPTARLSGEAAICAGDTAWLQVYLSGAPPWRLQVSINGVPSDVFENIMTEEWRFPAVRGGVYQILSVEDAHCNGHTHGSGYVDATVIAIEALVKAASCTGSADGSIEVRPAGGSAPYYIAWDNHAGQSPVREGLPAGFYPFTVTDAMGCKGVFTIQVPEPEPLQEVIFDCEDLRNPNFRFRARGGTPPYRYSIDGANFTTENLFQQLVPGAIYTLHIRDAEGCALLQPSFLLPLQYERMLTLPATLTVKIGEFFDIQPALHIPAAMVANIRWLPNELLSCTACLTPQAEALREERFTIRVTDIFGCSEEATVQIRLDREVDVFIPTAFSPDGNHVNDRFAVYANPRQVSEVLSFQVFDRWGNRMYAAEHFPPNDETQGWDGRLNGQLVNAGIFVYVARLKLIDGSEITRQGQALLMR